MKPSTSRRAFVLGSAASGLAARVFGRAPAVIAQSAQPVVVSSANGHEYKNGGPVTCVQKAFAMMTSGADVLDAVVAGVNIVELDPEETSVGYGGVPNADGIVQLDASVMHGPKRRAGAVAALEGVRTPSLVAQAVMDATDHQLLVGAGAQAFARAMGFRIEEDLNTGKSRSIWLEWKRKVDGEHYLDPKKRAESWRREIDDLVARGVLRADHVYGTINCDGVNAKGETCGVTTTSGLAFKIPGRVGDSPIIGAGLYVDTTVGAAGSTGRGEANLYNLCSFLIVEELRRGRAPKDAGMEALRRIKANTIEKRLLTPAGNPNFGIMFYVMNAKGEHAGVSMYAESGSSGPDSRARYAFCNAQGPHLADCEALMERMV